MSYLRQRKKNHKILKQFQRLQSLRDFALKLIYKRVIALIFCLAHHALHCLTMIRRNNSGTLEHGRGINIVIDQKYPRFRPFKNSCTDVTFAVPSLLKQYGHVLLRLVRNCTCAYSLVVNILKKKFKLKFLFFIN